MLRSRTDARWFQASHQDLRALLSDHLHCERKAAENALSLVRRYAGNASLVARLTRLAHEETSHVVLVAELLDERGMRLRSDAPNVYARALFALIRNTEPERQMDALLCAALIEARSHERLTLLADGFAAIEQPALAATYRALATAEDRHAEIYVELAREVAPDAVTSRLGELAAREAKILAGLPLACRIH